MLHKDKGWVRCPEVLLSSASPGDGDRRPQNKGAARFLKSWLGFYVLLQLLRSKSSRSMKRNIQEHLVFSGSEFGFGKGKKIPPPSNVSEQHESLLQALQTRLTINIKKHRPNQLQRKKARSIKNQNQLFGFNHHKLFVLLPSASLVEFST